MKKILEDARHKANHVKAAALDAEKQKIPNSSEESVLVPKEVW